MADRSKIEWTDASWNPIRARVIAIQNDGSGKQRIGWHCEHVSEGCRNCYAEGFNRRLGTGRDFKPGELYREEKKGFNNGEVKTFLDEQMLTQPLRWKKPRRIFVCSMSDLFADFVSVDMITAVFSVMKVCPQHTFQILTKRADRMAAIVGGLSCGSDGVQGPLPNVWLGVSAERQQEAAERIPLLLQTPAHCRFISAEPLLGEMRLDSLWHAESKRWFNALEGFAENCGGRKWIGKLDQVIVGGESGSKARPMHPAWPRSLRDQCAAAGTAFLFKQWGMFAPLKSALPVSKGGSLVAWPDGSIGEGRADLNGGPGEQLFKGTKDITGRLLDGVEHNEFPRVPA
ncbi:MAG: phage Gp37/Gp68 family protein [Bradyrhizobium sp.]|uniref:DUF5131 family protein n=1 Tax=Bradyrhizobium sp. TaxID=376 RepID=UPI0029B1C5CF|nr:phage Gp37/Gp68 family protein [Bradyrhizobium sp.]MDX3971126.1 phage Gp37/Gp68 family protein [Bradyrhizobium sp.]